MTSGAVGGHGLRSGFCVTLSGMRKFLVFLCVAVALGQDAIVVDLSPEDASNIARLYAEQAKIQAEIHKYRLMVGKKYATWGHVVTWYDGKSYRSDKNPAEFDFSKDFKHIVPKSTPATSSWTTGSTGNNLGCWTANPATIAVPYGDRN